jgi:hypothetical protein
MSSVSVMAYRFIIRKRQGSDFFYEFIADGS